MIQEKPTWVYRSEKGLIQAYGNVEMHNGRALGQWFCVDTKSGNILWEIEMEIPNTISGVAGNVIIATRTN